MVLTFCSKAQLIIITALRKARGLETSSGRAELFLRDIAGTMGIGWGLMSNGWSRHGRLLKKELPMAGQSGVGAA